MSTAETVQVDIVKIMAEIRREIVRKGFYDDLPTLDQVPVLECRKAESTDSGPLRERIANAMALCMIPSEYPIEGNAVKRAFKKASQKATRCSIFPMSNRISQANQALLQCLEQAASAIEQQQKQIADMEGRIEKLYEAMNRGELIK